MQTRSELLAAAQALRTTAATERRPLSAAESAQFDGYIAAIGQLDNPPAAITLPPGPAGHSGGTTAHSGGSDMAQETHYRQLVDQRAALLRQSEEVINAAATAGRNLTPEQIAEQKKNQREVEYLTDQINVLETHRDQLRNVEGGHGPRVTVGGPSLGGAPSNKRHEPWGYQYGVRYIQGADGATKYGGIPAAFDVALGDYLMAVRNASTPNSGPADPRLFSASVSGGSTGVPSDGGFLVGTDFSLALMELAMQQAVLAPRCRTIDISGNSDGLEAPYLNETSRANGSRWGGVRVYRAAEADTVSATKPTLQMFELRLADLMGIAYVTDRLLQDAAALGQVYKDAFTSEFAFKLDDEIFRGSGVGECSGIIDSTANPSLISQAVETGQTLADPIVAENIMNMFGRLHPRSRANAAFFITLELEPYLQRMQLSIGTGGQLVYMPAGGLTQAPYAQLYGRPVIPIEHASALGTVGDIVLADMSEYILIRKGGIQFDESMHVRFLYNERTFRWTQRVNGKSKWRSAMTPYKGTLTLSPFVTLAART